MATTGRQHGESGKSTRKRRRGVDPVRNALIVLSITVVTIALGIGLYLQFGVAFWLALVAALAIYIALISAHVLIRRVETVAALRDEVERLQSELEAARGGAHMTAASTSAGIVDAATKRELWFPVDIGAQAGEAQNLQRRHPTAAATGSLDYWASGAKAEPADAPRRADPVVVAAPAGASPVPQRTPHAAVERAASPAPVAEDLDVIQHRDSRNQKSSIDSYWAFRPAEPAMTEPPSRSKKSRANSSSGRAPFAPEPTLPPMPASAQRGSEPDVDFVRSRSQGGKHSSGDVVVPPPQSSAADSDLLKGLASASVIASYTPTSESGAPRAGSLAAKPVHEDAQEVDGLIRKLAADINAGRGNAKARPTRLEPELDDGVKALREAAQSMREAAAAASEDTLGRQYALQSALPGEPQKSTLESNEEFAMPVGLPALQPAHERLAEISAALAAENVEVLLEPIRSLADSKPEHYEISLRLKLDDGGLIGAGEVVQLAAGTGLLPLFDALRLERTMRVARKMEERQRPGAVMSGLTAESLADDDFLNVFADTYRGFASTAERLVISFTQDDVRGLTEAQQATLADMRDLGFRFAVTDIVDLDMDFEALVQIGFSFAKLDVAVVMRGMMAGDGLVSSRDVCRSFAKLGYSLVVGGISDDRERAEVLGFGAVFGQGTLFGGPRPVKADIVAAPRTVAA